MLQGPISGAEGPVHLQGGRCEAEHGPRRPGEVCRVGEPSGVGRRRERLAIHQERPDVQEPPPQYVGAQRHAGLLHEEVPEPAGGKVCRLGDFGEQHGLDLDGRAFPALRLHFGLLYTAQMGWRAGARRHERYTCSKAAKSRPSEEGRVFRLSQQWILDTTHPSNFALKCSLGRVWASVVLGQ
jgi:hypothetical protein